MLSASEMNAKDGRFSFRAPPEILKGLDELRRKEPDIPTRGEMLRRLVERAIAASKAKKDN